jgi:hypothetical protein
MSPDIAHEHRSALEENPLPSRESPPRVRHASRGGWADRATHLFGFTVLTAWVVAFLMLALAPIALGASYYALPFEQRSDHEFHELLRSGGYVGLLYGVIGTGLMIVMHLYTVRKTARWLPIPGSSAWWLRFHISCGLLGPLFIIVHGAIASPRGLVEVAFWCMILVATSGSFGRYVYGHLPKTAHGLQLDLDEAREELQTLRADLVRATTRGNPEAIGEAVRLAREFDREARSVVGLVALDWEFRKRVRRVKSLLRRAALEPGQYRMARDALVSQLKLKRALEAWEVSRRLFRLWHLFHAPLAQAMYIIVVVHIAYTTLVGGALETLKAGWP